MVESNVNLYEGLFLFDPGAVNASVADANEVLTQVLDRAEARIVAQYKWDERKLAYPIRGQKRGLYMISYFEVDGAQIANIERDVNLSEQVVRCLIIRADQLGEVELQAVKEKQTLFGESGASRPAAEPTAAPDEAAKPIDEPPIDQAPAPEDAAAGETP